VDTPEKTPMGFAEITEKVPEGWMKHQMRGGVDLALRRAALSPDRPRNWFAAVSQDTGELRNAVLNASKGRQKWNVALGGGEYTAVVLAQAPKPILGKQPAKHNSKAAPGPRSKK
jgi:hypothetical protein